MSDTDAAESNEDPVPDNFETGFEFGYAEGYLSAFAQLESGEARLLGWDPQPLQKDPVCEACGQEYPRSEYGLTLRDDVWAAVAPRPDEGYMASGLLCLDCIEKRLGREVHPDDVEVVVQYGERPTFRAAMLAMAFPVAMGHHLVDDD